MQNNMTIKKVSYIAKLEDLRRIQLSKSFFMRDCLIPLNLPLKRETCPVIHLIRVVTSPFRRGLGRGIFLNKF